MVFERASITDMDQLVKLRIEYLTEDFGDISKDQLIQINKKLPSYYHKHLNVDLFVYVCRADDDIVSCCFLCVTEKPSSPSFLNGKIGAVLNVYTKPEYRRKGIAGKLLKLLLSDSEKMGLDHVELKATDSGYNLYRSIGFEDVISKYHNMKFVLNAGDKS